MLTSKCSVNLLRQGVGALQDSVRHLLTLQNISWSNLEVLPWKRSAPSCPFPFLSIFQSSHSQRPPPFPPLPQRCTQHHPLFRPRRVMGLPLPAGKQTPVTSSTCVRRYHAAPVPRIKLRSISWARPCTASSSPHPAPEQQRVVVLLPWPPLPPPCSH
jgi:hypothetical protein